jgi:hypothetical protein
MSLTPCYFRPCCIQLGTRFSPVGVGCCRCHVQLHEAILSNIVSRGFGFIRQHCRASVLSPLTLTPGLLDLGIRVVVVEDVIVLTEMEDIQRQKTDVK